MRSSLSLSAPEAVSAALACSVHTVQPSDRRHAHSLLLSRSKVVRVLSSIYSSYFRVQSPRSLTRATPPVHQRHLPLIPPSPIARHSLPRSPSVPVNHRRHHPFTAAVAALSLPSPSVYQRCRLPPLLPPLPPLPPPLLPPLLPFTAAYCCRSFSTIGSGIN
jgi:hypothetical protein